MTFSIVVIAYDRPKSLSRLLESLSKITYNKKIDLIISIDYKLDNVDVTEVAEKFLWRFGNKRIINHTKNMGLKNHVLFCGDLTNEYDNVVILEDDLIVAPNLANYCEQVLSFYDNTDDIAGFSLYTHQKNIENNLPFIPLKTNSDVFLVQYAMSWGQIWTRKQWNSFKYWLEIEDDNDFSKNILPSHLSTWSDKSWLKHHIKYCIEKEKFFVYPYQSLTSNSSEVGTHSNVTNSDFQVPLEYIVNNEKKYLYDEVKKLEKYDSFFENTTRLSKFINEKYGLDNIEIDLYGEKKLGNKRYLLSSNLFNFKIIDSFKMELKPIELNILYQNYGNDIHLYDTQINVPSTKDRKREIRKNLYFFDRLSLDVLIKQLISKIKNKVHLL